jgi:hypothetical protein
VCFRLDLGTLKAACEVSAVPAGTIQIASRFSQDYRPGLLSDVPSGLVIDRYSESDRWASPSSSAHVRFGERGAPVDSL